MRSTLVRVNGRPHSAPDGAKCVTCPAQKRICHARCGKQTCVLQLLCASVNDVRAHEVEGQCADKDH